LEKHDNLDFLWMSFQRDLFLFDTPCRPANTHISEAVINRSYESRGESVPLSVKHMWQFQQWQ